LKARCGINRAPGNDIANLPRRCYTVHTFEISGILFDALFSNIIRIRPPTLGTSLGKMFVMPRPIAVGTPEEDIIWAIEQVGGHLSIRSDCAVVMVRCPFLLRKRLKRYT
jgi:hypothetical protein